jgi:hypothetical protein
MLHNIDKCALQRAIAGERPLQFEYKISPHPDSTPPQHETVFPG